MAPHIEIQFSTIQSAHDNCLRIKLRNTCIWLSFEPHGMMALRVRELAQSLSDSNRTCKKTFSYALNAMKIW